MWIGGNRYGICMCKYTEDRLDKLMTKDERMDYLICIVIIILIIVLV